MNIPRRALLTAVALLSAAGSTLGQRPCFVTKQTAVDPDGDDRYGWSVAICEDVTVSAAFKHDDNGLNSGAVYVHRFDGTDWVFEQELLASDGMSQDRFGWSVDTNASRIVIGAREDNDPVDGSNTGSAYVFMWDGATWIEEQKLVALDADPDDEFGTSVAMNGDLIVVGADGDDEGGSGAGAAYVFELSGAVWSQVAKLLASDAGAGDGFGGSVAIDADVIAVGAPLESAVGSFAGAAYVFRSVLGTWSEQDKLAATDLATNDRFGSDVSVSGSSVLVGAMNAPSTGANDSGAAYVFVEDGGNWTEEQKLEANDSSLGDLFGWSVSIDGDVALIGAYLEDGAGSDSGAAYGYGRVGDTWTQRTKFIDDDTAASDAFGFSVDLWGERLLVGAWGDDDIEDESGSAYVFTWEPSIGANYCSGEPNSVGPGATLSATGSPVVADDDFRLTARCALPGGPGLFFMGTTMVNAPFGEGRRCTGGMVLRLNPPVFADAAGTATRGPSLQAMPLAGNVLAGSGWNAQYWYRDQVGGPDGFNLSDGVHVDFQ